MNGFWKNKKVLITGAAGFVGSNAVDYFLRKGAVVTAAVSPKVSKSKITINLGPNMKKVKIMKADLLYPNEAEKVTKKQQIVLNFAAVDGNISFKNKYSTELFSQNMRIALNMLEASKKTVERFLLVSSSDIYISEARSPITEHSPIGVSWEHKIDGYKLAKWVSELVAREFDRQFGLKSVIIRPSNLYGPRDEFENKEKTRFIPVAIKSVIKEKEDISLWGNGKQIRTFLYIEDFIDICARLIEKDASNFPINVASPDPVTLKEVVDEISELAGVTRKIKIDSSKPGGAKVRFFDTRLLTKIIKPQKLTSLKEGLKKTIEFYKRNYL